MRYFLYISIAISSVFSFPKIRSLPDGIFPGMDLRARPSDLSDISPASNAIGDIEYNARTGDIWVSTGNGLAVSRDGGNTWENKIPGKGFSALALLGDWVWAASNYSYPDPTDPHNTFPAGDGFYVSFDRGENFQHYRGIRNAEGVGRLAYDIAIVPDRGDTIVYAACFYGGLIATADAGTTWVNIFPDGTDSLDYSNLAHRFFSVAVDTSADPPLVWAGSAKGLYAGRFDDFAWELFDTAGHWLPESIAIIDTASSDTSFYIRWNRDWSAVGRISGNWIISIDFLFGSQTGIFACTRYTSTNARGSDYDAISYSFDNGMRWAQTGTGFIAWNMGFTGDTLWSACSHGLMRSRGSDYSCIDTIELIGTDAITGLPLRILVKEVISVADCGGRIYVGTYSEGLAFSDDRGETWKILSNFPDPESASKEDPGSKKPEDYVYAYPSPFSPRYHGGCFFVFKPTVSGSAKIELFDYDVKKVHTIWDGGFFTAGQKTRVQWDGKLYNGATPANGLYFFKITTADGAYWGKIVVID